VTDELAQLAEKADRLVRSARLQDLALLLASNDVDRIRRIAVVLEELGSGTFLIGTGPYAAGVYSVMADEIVLGRLATPLEDPLDMPVDIFCRDVPSLTPREVSRYHAMLVRAGDANSKYLLRDLGSTCGTFVNGTRIPSEPDSPLTELSSGDTISLGPSHVNTFLFVTIL
jgi:pSer/pThr/pTyr-binding forkhead associated (FHA) protein